MSSAQPLAQRLRDRRAELVRRKQRVERDLSHREEPVVADFDDGAIQQENDEVLGTIAATIDAELAAIDKAMARSAQGLLGICEKCQQPISSERLAVVPYAVTCSTCEAE
jgi:DnaK suppressor protein